MSMGQQNEEKKETIRSNAAGIRRLVDLRMRCTEIGRSNHTQATTLAATRPRKQQRRHRRKYVFLFDGYPYKDNSGKGECGTHKKTILRAQNYRRRLCYECAIGRRTDFIVIRSLTTLRR